MTNRPDFLTRHHDILKILHSPADKNKIAKALGRPVDEVASLKDDQIPHVEPAPKPSEEIYPLELAVYRSTPDSCPSEEMMKKMCDIVNHVTAVSILGFQATTLIMERGADRKFNGILYYDYYDGSWSYYKAIRDRVQPKIELPQVPIGLGPISQSKLKEGMDYTISAKLIESAHIPDNRSVLGIAVPATVGNRGLAGYGERERSSLIIQFDAVEQKLGFESAIKTSPRHGLNAFFSGILSYEGMGDLYHYSGDETKTVSSIKTDLFPKKSQFESNIGSILGVTSNKLLTQTI